MCKYKAYATCSVHALLENKEYKMCGYNAGLANIIQGVSKRALQL
jgi:hypothetical protein